MGQVLFVGVLCKWTNTTHPNTLGAMSELEGKVK
jgi:hypothetical protein